MHFTYVAEPNLSELEQGDIIGRSLEVDAILKDVHPHYLKADYKAFIVLTQSCDLVRRGGRCKTRYVSLAAVRPLSLVLDREFDRLCIRDFERALRVSDVARREKMWQFVERLLNNNEDEYFFLYREPNGGLNQDACAFLQLSIAVKSELHYETLLRGKKLQLNESFQHKLGYLVGKLYSRVATVDWVPDSCSPEEFRQRIDEMIANRKFALWLETDVFKSVVRELEKTADAKTAELLTSAIEKVASAKLQRKQAVIDAVKKTLDEVGVARNDVERVRKRLESDAVLSANIR